MSLAHQCKAKGHGRMLPCECDRRSPTARIYRRGGGEVDEDPAGDADDRPSTSLRCLWRRERGAAGGSLSATVTSDVCRHVFLARHSFGSTIIGSRRSGFARPHCASLQGFGGWPSGPSRSHVGPAGPSVCRHSR
jgi:hypothetical protein